MPHSGGGALDPLGAHPATGGMGKTLRTCAVPARPASCGWRGWRAGCPSPVRLPARSRVGLGLVGPGLVLAPSRSTGRRHLTLRLRDQPLVGSVCGSVTVTTPLVRWRRAVPVGHPLRVRCYDLPASCRIRRMGLVRMRGLPSRRQRRCTLLRGHVARPAGRRSGGCWAVATI
jgi:hypothetical protein